MDKKDIDSVNSKGVRHGYQEWYHEGVMYRRGNYKNGIPTGYHELNMHKFNKTNFHIR